MSSDIELDFVVASLHKLFANIMPLMDISVMGILFLHKLASFLHELLTLLIS